MSLRTRTIGLAVVLGMLTICAAVAAAQNPPREGRGRGMRDGTSSVMLLRSEQVQKELKLTDEQKTKLQALADKIRSETRQRMSGLRDLSSEERRKKFDEMRPEMQKLEESQRKDVAAILNPDQARRFRQIELQQLRSAALLQADVATTLRLTEEQKKKLQEVATQTAEKLQTQTGEGTDRQQSREKRRQLRDDGDKQAMAILTQEQKTKLTEMLGQPFQLDRSQLGTGRRGNRGQRGSQPQ